MNQTDDETAPGRFDEARSGVVVPYHELSAEALSGIVESFVLREGTEYGESDVSLVDKVSQVIAQLRRGEAQIVYDRETQSVDIILAS